MTCLASTTRFPEAHARLLAEASTRCALGVITNFDDTATAYAILARHGILPRLGTVVVSEAVGLRKPNPLLVALALRDLGVAPGEAVLIGDHPIEDVGAATAAGVDAVWIDTAGDWRGGRSSGSALRRADAPGRGADPRQLLRGDGGTGRRSSRASIACAAAGWR